MKKKRYQFFISSTYTDLIEERKSIIHQILETENIPVGMEFFPSSDKDQFSYISELIEQSDFFFLILAARYGSIVKGEEISFVEREYNFAKEKNIPVYVFLHSEPQEIPSNKSEEKVSSKRKLANLRKRVSDGHLVSFWNDLLSLTKAISATLDSIQNKNDRPGWVRTTDFQNDKTESQNTIELKNSEIALLQKELSEVKELVYQNDSVVFWQRPIAINVDVTVFEIDSPRMRHLDQVVQYTCLKWFMIIAKYIISRDTIISNRDIQSCIRGQLLEDPIYIDAFIKQSFESGDLSDYELHFDVDDREINIIKRFLMNENLIEERIIEGIDFSDYPWRLTQKGVQSFYKLLDYTKQYISQLSI